MSLRVQAEGAKSRMQLVNRAAAIDDFEQFYYASFPEHRDNTIMRAGAQHEWQVLLRNPTTLSLLVEDAERPMGKRIVACGQAVFVTEHFAALARAGLSPWMKGHATHPLPDGKWPLLSLEGVRLANSGDGLIALVTEWFVVWQEVNPSEAIYLRGYLHDSFIALSRGYKFKEILIEATGEEAREEALRAGFRMLNDYTRYYQEHPPQPPLHAHPYLLHLTREAASGNTGSSTSYAFAYTPPRFFFTAREQEVLRLAMAGAEDAEIAAVLGLSIWTIHSRWKSIYTRVQKGMPVLLPDQDEGRRGAEKRRVLLHYLQTHPEELRPINPPRQKDR